MPTILIVEDEQYISELLTVTFEREGFTTHVADGVDAAYEKLGQFTVDVVLLDLNLQGKSGFEICHYIKHNHPAIGVIMVTAKGQDVDKVYGLEVGADDYVVKPFNPYELVARVRSLLRRMNVSLERINALPQTQSQEEEKINPNLIQFDNLTVDAKGKRLLLDAKEVKTTPKEFELVYFLSQNPSVVYSRDELLDKIWGIDMYVDFKTVDVHIARLREKLEDNPKKPKFIETVWGVGYKWRG